MRPTKSEIRPTAARAPSTNPGRNLPRRFFEASGYLATLSPTWKFEIRNGLPCVATSKARAKQGQAMIELIVGLVAILALVAGLLQVASLTRIHTDTMVEARREAGELAMLDIELMMNPDYILDWREGPDTKRYTRDDIFTSADPVIFDDTIVEKASADSAGWETLHEVPDNRLSQLHDSLSPVSHFGLVVGRDTRSVSLISAVQSLLYRADTIDVECEVWMTWTKGIY